MLKKKLLHVVFMADFVSKAMRSKIMASIKSKDTSIDKKVALLLRAAGIKFRRYPKMPSNPDFLLLGKKTVIFCDGDFWHGYKFKELEKRLPKPWKEKIRNNMRRDRQSRHKLRKEGWKVVRLWEHEINRSPRLCLKRVTLSL